MFSFLQATKNTVEVGPVDDSLFTSLYDWVDLFVAQILIMRANSLPYEGRVIMARNVAERMLGEDFPYLDPGSPKRNILIATWGAQYESLSIFMDLDYPDDTVIFE